MQTTLTAKLKLTTTSDQFAALRTTQLAYRDGLNLVSQYAFAHGKSSSRRRLQRDLYTQVRSQCTLPAQMACSVFRQVGATYQGLWTKARKNAEALRKGYTKKRFRGLDKAPHYVSPTLSYVYRRDYSLCIAQQVSLLTLSGRIHVGYQGYAKHVALLEHGTCIGGAKLWYDRSKKRFYLLVSVTMVTPDPEPCAVDQVIGIDVGQRYLATVATINGSQFYSGKEIRQQADHSARLRKRLQRKGTRSATRRRTALAQRERRLKLNTNHCISRQFVDTHPNAFIGIEDLTHIRERTRRRKYGGKGQHVEPVSVKARKANRHESRWAFAELQNLLTYKATLARSVCIKVDADYTSQSCPKCGFVSKANRKDAGLLFVCRRCHYMLHADLVGARNILLRTLVIRQGWVATGQLSEAPNVTDQEAIRCTPGSVCRVAVESGHKLIPVQGSESLTSFEEERLCVSIPSIQTLSRNVLQA